jgi:hypothetical protein
VVADFVVFFDALVAGLAAVVVVVDFVVALIGVAPAAEHLANLPEASLHRVVEAVVVVVGHLVNLPDASRQDAASAWPAVKRSAAAAAAKRMEVRRMLTPFPEFRPFGPMANLRATRRFLKLNR